MIVTLTANPSADRAVLLPGPLVPGEVQRADSSREDAGGKGDRDRRSGRDHFFARHQARGGFIHLDRRKGTGYADDFAHQFLFADQHSFQHGKGSGVFHFYDRAID